MARQAGDRIVRPGSPEAKHPPRVRRSPASHTPPSHAAAPHIVHVPHRGKLTPAQRVQKRRVAPQAPVPKKLFLPATLQQRLAKQKGAYGRRPEREVVARAPQPSALGTALDIASLIPVGGLGVRGGRLGIAAITKALAEKGGARVVAKAGARAAPGAALKAGKKTARVGFGGSLVAPFAVGIPETAISGDPKKLLGEITGTGTLADVTSKIGKAVGGGIGGVPGNLAKDLIDLPAQAVPSIALPLAALGQAAAGARRGGPAGIRFTPGSTKHIEKLWADYKKTGIIPPLVSGHPGEALKRAGKHPLYAALELSGAKAVAGRGAGAAARSGAFGRGAKRAAATAREPLRVYPRAVAEEGPQIKRPYSRDVVNKAVQVLAERSRAKRVGERNVMTRGQRAKFIRNQVDETQAVSVGRQQAERALSFTKSEKALGRPGAFNRTVRRQKRPGEQAGVDAMIASGIARSPETFYTDVSRYRDTLKAAETKAKSEKERVRYAEARKARKTVDAVLANRNLDVEGAFAGVKRYGEEIAKPQEAQLVERGIYGEEQMGAKNVPAGIVHEGIKYDHKLGGFRDRGGEPITLAEVGARLKAKGIDPVFFSQRRPTVGRGLFRGIQRRPTVPGQPRTGTATAGGFDMPSDLLPREAAKRSVLLEADKGFERHLDDLAIKIAVKDEHGNEVGKGYAHGYKHAETIANEINEAQGTDLEPVNIAALRDAGRRLAAAKSRMDLNLPEEKLLDQFSDRIRAAFEGTPDQGGRWALMSHQAKERILEQNQPTGTGLKALQSVTNTWKRVILATSKGWIPGNVIDLTIRAGLEGLTPRDWRTGKRLMAIWRDRNHEAASIFEERGLGGGVFRTTEKTSPYRRAEQFEGSALEGTARALARAGRAPGVRTAVSAFNEWAKAIFFGNGKIELNYRYAALGKHVRRNIRTVLDDQARWLGRSEKALSDYIEKGLTDTPDQTAAARFVERVYGRWGKLSPDGRKFVATAGPFIQWLRVASKLVFVTLPAHHPIKTAILATVSEMSENERKQLGLTLFPAKDANAAWDPLQGGIPTGDGRILAFQSKTSFGIMSEFPMSLGSFINPQFRDAINAFNSTDWTGKEIRRSDGEKLDRLQRVMLAIGLTAEGFAPGGGYAQRLIQGKPVGRTFSPFFIGSAQNKGGKSGGTKLNLYGQPTGGPSANPYGQPSTSGSNLDAYGQPK